MARLEGEYHSPLHLGHDALDRAHAVVEVSPIVVLPHKLADLLLAFSLAGSAALNVV